MSDETTARTSSRLEQRARRQAFHARLLRRALDLYDVSQAELALLCGIAESKVQRWLDPNSRERSAAHELEVFPDGVAIELLRELAVVHGYTLAILPIAKKPADDITMLAGAAKESGEALAAAAKCITPGKPPTREDLLEVERQATEALEAIATMRDRAREQLDALNGPPATPRLLAIRGART